MFSVAPRTFGLLLLWRFRVREEFVFPELGFVITHPRRAWGVRPWCFMRGMLIILLPSPSPRISLYQLCWFNISSRSRLYQSQLFLRLKTDCKKVTSPGLRMCLLAVWEGYQCWSLRWCMFLHFYIYSLCTWWMGLHIHYYEEAIGLPSAWHCSMYICMYISVPAVYCCRCIHHRLITGETLIYYICFYRFLIGKGALCRLGWKL